MPNTLLTPTQVTRKALQILHQKLRFVASINKQYDPEFAQKGAKIGSTLTIRLPNQYTVRTGATLTTQDTTEQSVVLTVATQKGVDLNFTSADLTLSLDDFSTRILNPAMAVLAAGIEADALNMRKDVWNQANNTASAATLNNVLTGRKLMVDNLTPFDDDVTCLLRTTDNLNLVDSLKTLFQASDEIKTQYRKGVMGTAAGFDFMETTQLGAQLRGSGANYLVNTTVSTQGSTSLTVVTGTGTIKQGEIITVAAVNSVHPETKVAGAAQQFVVTADYAGGAGTLSVSPAMYTTGALQNIDAFPQSGAAITIAGTASTNYGQSLAFHKNAFTFVTADLVMPNGVDFSARENYDGISIRIVRQYDINNDKFPCRLDVLYGYKTIRGQMAARLANLL